jgi:hypothetical protein
MIKNILFALSITLIMTACPGKKTADPTPSSSSSTSVCYMTSSTTNGTKDYDLTYDNNNRLNSMIGYTPAGNATFTFQYDANNRVIKASGSSSGIIGDYTTYHYDVNGRIDRDTLYKLTNLVGPVYTADSINTFTYTGNNITREDNIKIGGVHLYSTYAYNSTGDITQEIDYDNTGAILQTLVFTLDNKNSNITPLFFIDPVAASQKHNGASITVTSPTSGVDNSQSYTATFTYNATGYPLTETDNYLDGTVDNITYTYTCK